MCGTGCIWTETMFFVNGTNCMRGGGQVKICVKKAIFQLPGHDRKSAGMCMEL